MYCIRQNFPCITNCVLVIVVQRLRYGIRIGRFDGLTVTQKPRFPFLDCQPEYHIRVWRNGLMNLTKLSQKIDTITLVRIYYND